jgi:hypothetical protein
LETEDTKVDDSEMDKEIEIILTRFGSEEVVNKLKELYVP